MARSVVTTCMAAHGRGPGGGSQTHGAADDGMQRLTPRCPAPSSAPAPRTGPAIRREAEVYGLTFREPGRGPKGRRETTSRLDWITGTFDGTLEHPMTGSTITIRDGTYRVLSLTVAATSWKGQA
jgi:hypothetical protein